MRHSLGVWVGATWSIAALTLLFTIDSRAVYSSAWVIDIVVSLSVILWPVVLGASAADSVRLFRASGSRELIGALPTTLAWRMLVRRVCATALWAAAGMLLALSVGLGIALLRGSSPTPSAAFTVVLAAVGCLAFAAIGQAIGLILPSWLTPPIAAVAFYLSYGFRFAGIGAMFLFVAAGSPLSNSYELRPDIFSMYLGTLVLTTVGALLMIAAKLARLRAATVLLALGTASTLFGGGLTISQSEGDGVFDYLSADERSCTEIPDGSSRVCVSQEQSSRANEVAELLAPLDAKVRALSPGAGTISYSPFTFGSKTDIFFEPPLGQSELDQSDVAMTIVHSLVDCSDPLPLTDEVDAAMSVVATWIVPDFSGEGMLLATADFSNGPPTLTEAKDALEYLRQCHAVE